MVRCAHLWGKPLPTAAPAGLLQHTDGLSIAPDDGSDSSSCEQYGQLRDFFGGKGFGFVTPANGEADIFVHVKDNPGLVGCQKGQAVSYYVVWDERKGRYQGVDLVGI